MQHTLLQPLKSYYIRLEKGEEIYSKIENFCKENNIKFADFYGIGALEDIDYGVYHNGEYEKFKEKAVSELTSLIGNVSLDDSQYLIHSHATFSKLDKNQLYDFSGHLLKAKVAVTVEIKLNSYQNTVSRFFDQETNIKLLKF